ncbi:MAG: sigma-70 family RNA polymerase sigma factor [Acidobacteria bacterium]|nr:sigma-70 family RNA polymerase sigma factor [Acidobacteriota bacterium]
MTTTALDSEDEPQHDVTRLLNQWGRGDRSALDAIMVVVHRDLHQIARACMAGERPGHSLQATALVNEAYLRLADVERMDWQNRSHFLAMAARVMRRVLVDHARSKQYQKRGGGAARVTLDEFAIANDTPDEITRLDDALTDLEQVDARKARVVEMRFFGGLSVDETAEALDVSPETVMRDWKRARLWLLQELQRR